MPLHRFTFSLALAGVLAAAPSTHAQAPAIEYDGAAATGLALRRLGTTARVLHIGAHPDDENTALFAPLALGRGVDAAYLSLTRGEGGQNGIGPELGVALGLIRSEELLAARRIDGGGQFFSRAIDYGYSKSAEEAFRHWPHDSLLADVVRIIRRYRPDVVASVWSGTSRDGHGQHEASGIIAREAALAAGDRNRFPEQIAEGLRPHSPALYYRSAWFGEGPPDVELNTGRLDPLLGASYHQVAMASRSRHRSQDQGNRQDPGPRRTAFDQVDPSDPVEVADERRFGRYAEGAPRGETSLFLGVDTLLSQRAARLVAGDVAATESGAATGSGGSAGATGAAAGTPAPVGATAAAGALAPHVVSRLREYERLAATARREFDALAPWELLPTLVRARGILLGVAEAVDRAAEAADPAEAAGLEDLAFHLDDEAEDLRDALLRAANVQLSAVADEQRVVPGQTFQLELAVWNGGVDALEATVAPSLPAGWRARPVDELAAGEPAGSVAVRVAPGDRATAAFRVTVPDDAAPTMPYYLDPTGPPPVDLYDWPADPAVRGLPFASDPVRGAFSLGLSGTTPIELEREAEWIGIDRRSGEFTRPVKVVPAVAVALEPDLAVVPVGGERSALDFTVRLRSQAGDTVAGELRLELPEGWSAEPASVPIRLAGEGAQRAVRFEVRPPANLAPAAYPVSAHFVTPRQDYRLGYDVVDYPHIAPHHLYRAAAATVRGLDVEVADVRVGYVPGSGDGVPQALEQLGVEWTSLDAAALADGDLDRFDVIITGARAYEVNDDLVAQNQRLLAWVRDGGTLIVQYNKYPALTRDYAPWPVTIARPHGRVTDETAPVTVLQPDHPILTVPNDIGPADWEGWVQERGLYFWETWEGPLEPLLAMSDPGEEALTGSLLVAPLGDGTYVYTGLALFRQLPVGVPGAYRLLANLISLGTE